MVEDRAERRLTTILAADVVGYSRLMAADEAGTLVSLKALRRELIEPKTAEYHGRVVKLMGDGTLMEFASVVDAVNFAVDVQRAMALRNTDVPEDQRITYRIGINIGDIIVDGEDIYGDGVNVAARLEGLAEPGGICVSRPVHTQVRGKVDTAFEDLGKQQVKNIPEPVQIFKVLLDAPPAAHIAASAPAAKRSLRWPVVAGGLALLVAVAGIVLWQRPWQPREEPASVEAMAFPLPDKPSIAVLPFNNMSDDASQEYFTDGMTEDLITDLSKLSGLFVIARNSSFSYKGRQVKIRKVAEELGVRYVLEGSVRRDGNEVRINAQLIDATTGGHLWAERYDGALDDIFDLQDKVTQQIVAALAVNLTGEEQAQRARHNTEIAAAHDAYLQGWAHYKLATPEALAEALPFFEEALRLDPNYAQAHAALASLYWDAFKNDWAFDLGMPSVRAESRASEHLEEALKVPTPLAHTLQARMLASWGFLDDAVAEAEKAVALDGNDATALAGLAHALILAGQPSQGEKAIQEAMRLDPHHPASYLTTLGHAQFMQERYAEAAVIFERAIKRNPEDELPRILLGATFGHLGRIEDGEATIEAANDLRNRVGLGALSLERKTSDGYTPFRGEIDFALFGNKAARNRLRAGLAKIPAMTWHYRVITHLAGENTWYEIKGATVLDLATAKSFHDRGVLFLDVSNEDVWLEAHVPGAIHLPNSPIHRNKQNPTKPRLKETTLREVVKKDEEVVLYWYSPGSGYPAYSTAKAVNWGYKKIYYFVGGARAWKEAGYPVEAGE